MMIALLYVILSVVQHMCSAEGEHQLLGWNTVGLLLI